MKIAILTLPLHVNYGGNVQNFALQQTLLKLGMMWLLSIAVKLR